MADIPKVMLVDDSETNRELIKEVLNGAVEFIEAEDGLQAWKAYNRVVKEGKTDFDLILLDIAMPNMDGIKLLRLIRELEIFERIPIEERLPVLIVTAHANRVEEAMQAGANGHLLKPIDVEALKKQVQSLVTKVTD